MKRKYLTAIELRIAKAFKNGFSMECIANLNGKLGGSTLWEDRRRFVQNAIRKAMKMRRWWVPAPPRPPAKGRNKEER